MARRRPSPVASHGDTVIRECLSNYDSTQCRPCWWRHTWGTRYMLFIPDNGHFVAQLSDLSEFDFRFQNSHVCDTK